MRSPQRRKEVRWQLLLPPQARTSLLADDGITAQACAMADLLLTVVRCRNIRASERMATPLMHALVAHTGDGHAAGPR